MACLVNIYCISRNYRGVITATHEGHKDRRVDGQKPTSDNKPTKIIANSFSYLKLLEPVRKWIMMIAR